MRLKTIGEQHLRCTLVIICIVFLLLSMVRYKNIDSKMVEMVKNEIMDQGEPVEWDDIAGLKFAKKTVTSYCQHPLAPISCNPGARDGSPALEKAGHFQRPEGSSQGSAAFWPSGHWQNPHW